MQAAPVQDSLHQLLLRSCSHCSQGASSLLQASCRCHPTQAPRSQSVCSWLEWCPLQVPVAVKKLKPEVLTNARDLREFLAEANALRQLKHR